MRYVIVGAGGFGREICCAIRYNRQRETSSAGENDSIVFVDDNLKAPAGMIDSFPPVVAKTAEYEPEPEDRVFIAIGDPQLRRKFAGILKKRCCVFTGIVHCESTFFGKCLVGDGSHIGWGVGVSCDVTVGNFVSLNCNLTVGHDAVIEDFVEVGPGTAIGGFCHIEEGVHIAPNCTIAPGVRVGAWSKISANTAVMRDVPPLSYVVGVPGVVHRNFFKRPDEEY